MTDVLIVFGCIALAMLAIFVLASLITVWQHESRLNNLDKVIRGQGKDDAS